jgi:hypothetical protein
MKTLIVIATFIVSAAVGQSGPNLQETFDWMSRAVSDWGTLHPDARFDQQFVLRGNATECRVYIDGAIEDKLHIPKGKIYFTEDQMHLANVDPQRISITKMSDRYDVKIESTNDEYKIWLFWWTSEKDRPNKEPAHLYTGTTEYIQFRDKEHAERFARAFRHAVELCGGKPSAF